MHLVHCQPKSHYLPFYNNETYLTRSNSLPYLFRKLRIYQNLTRNALAKKFGTSEQYVTKIEEGTLYPSLKFCLQCADLFEINPCWVKRMWSREIITRFTERIEKRLGLDD